MLLALQRHIQEQAAVTVQILGLVGSPGKGKHVSFERVRRGMLEVCEALHAHVVTPMTHLHALEARLHKPQVYGQTLSQQELTTCCAINPVHQSCLHQIRCVSYLVGASAASLGQQANSK